MSTLYSIPSTLDYSLHSELAKVSLDTQTPNAIFAAFLKNHG